MTRGSAFMTAVTAVFLLVSCSSDTDFGDFEVTPLPDAGAADAETDVSTDDATNPDDTADDVDPDVDPDGGTTDGDTPDGEPTDVVEPDAADLCGNELRDTGELCDGADVGATSCVDFGFGGGSLGCAVTCDAFDFSACEEGPVCGDNMRDGGELCDGTDLGTAACTDFAFDGGTLGCAEGCGGYDFSGCERDGGGDPVCGNGLLEAGEACDGAALAGASCMSAGFDRGSLACAGDCSRLDTSLCENDACTPNCGGRECGVDPICGVSCGSCGGGETCDAAGQCIAPGDSGPRFITFNTNVIRITDDETVRFTAVVTDPDGIDDLIGGTLRDPVSGATYGSFTTSAAEGSYQIELSWNDIHFVRDISFEDERVRSFEAEFFDTAANRSTRTIDITLFCDEATAPAACDGVCVDYAATAYCGGCDIACASGGFCAAAGPSFGCACGVNEADCSGRCTSITTTSNCGGCGVSCRSDQLCDGACICGVGLSECGGACTGLFNSGTCGESCTACADDDWCDGERCLLPAGGDVRIDGATNTVQLYNESSWRPICDDAFGVPDGEVLCRMMGGTYLGHLSNRLSGQATYWLDDLQCTGDEDDVLDCAGAVLGSENCSANEGVELRCEFAGGIAADCLPYAPGDIVINEFQTVEGDGTPAFVEIKAAPFADLSRVTLEFVNFLGSTDRWVFDAGSTADSGGHYYGAASASADQNFSIDAPVVSNGLIRVLDCEGTVLDQVGYGETVGEGAPLPTQGFADTYGRIPDGADSGDNSSDFQRVAPTPGTSNIDGIGDLYRFEGTVSTTNSTFLRPAAGCLSSSTLRRYGVLTLTNPGRTLDVTITATHDDFDGWLVVYSPSFSERSPTTNCRVSADDYFGQAQSRATVAWRAGEDLVIILTSFDNVLSGVSSDIGIVELP